MQLDDEGIEEVGHFTCRSNRSGPPQLAADSSSPRPNLVLDDHATKLRRIFAWKDIFLQLVRWYGNDDVEVVCEDDLES